MKKADLNALEKTLAHLPVDLKQPWPVVGSKGCCTVILANEVMQPHPGFLDIHATSFRPYGSRENPRIPKKIIVPLRD